MIREIKFNPEDIKKRSVDEICAIATEISQEILDNLLKDVRKLDEQRYI